MSWLGATWLLASASPFPAAELEECRTLFRKGNYRECLRQTGPAIQQERWDDGWPILQAQAQLALGQYPAALKTVTDGLERYRSSLRLRLVAWEVFKSNGLTERATEILDELTELAASRSRYSRDVSTLVALGKAALLLNADPKIVLVNFFDEAKRLDPKYREAYLAGGELALDKHDYALAAKTFAEALQAFPDDPDAQFGLARAYAPSDATQTAQALEAVLDYNTNHVPALLLLADHAVDGEAYAEAEKMLKRALAVNPWHPEAWAYEAVLAQLRNEPEAETQAHQKALKYWGTNPRVDSLIGLKLSQKYRFAEGSAYQQQALKFDPHYLPAKLQLAQDWLRLGKETAGWQLAHEVHESDAYDVTAFNLVTLHDAFAKFQTLTNQDFVVRMSAREAELYGDRVLAVLGRAKEVLSQKYGLQPVRPTTVEIFPEQKDFAVRTFGLPDNPGFLGVCFGQVITANSPASQTAHPANWEAVLWHEFCHVITLQLTRNKMPRWLSEGISVYEERQANPAWSEKLSPRYREMILGDSFTPVGKLSAAFLSPKSPYSIPFAYYESSLVVEYLVQNFGLQALKQILLDLGQGVAINDAIARETAPLDKIEAGFAAFARQRAEQLAPGLDWTKPKEMSLESTLLEGQASGTNAIRRGRAPRRGVGRSGTTNVVLVDTNLSAPPSTKPLVAATNVPATGLSGQPALPVKRVSGLNYYKVVEQAKAALAAQKWSEAKVPLQQLIELYPTQTGPDSAYVLLAAVHRALNETNQERQVLVKVATMEADASAVFLRLTELDEAFKDWKGVAANAEHFLAVNPLLPQPYRSLARASEELGRADPAIRAYERLLLLDPPDPAEVHYRLARLLRQKGELARAKRHLLQALEEAPRFRDAQRLLLELQDQPTKASGLAPDTKS